MGKNQLSLKKNGGFVRGLSLLIEVGYVYVLGDEGCFVRGLSLLIEVGYVHA